MKSPNEEHEGKYMIRRLIIILAVWMFISFACNAHEYVSKDELKDQDLSGEKFNDYQLSGVDLSGKILRGVDFTGSLCRETKFDKSNLQEAIFAYVDLRNATFIEADLTGADLRKTNLHGANFTKAKMEKMSFSDVDLSGAIVDYASFVDSAISEEQILKAASYKCVTLPDGALIDPNDNCK